MSLEVYLYHIKQMLMHSVIFNTLCVQEAAIYIKEGKDNEKFNHHPNSHWSKIAFKILHHPAYYITHLIVTILLMLLALAENHPMPGGQQISNQARLSILMVYMPLCHCSFDLRDFHCCN